MEVRDVGMMYAGFIVGLVLLGFFIISPLNDDVEDLGGSICLEEHNADFVNYYDGVLTCKDKLNSYDGIFVEVV